jgi:hypothetical protein
MENSLLDFYHKNQHVFSSHEDPGVGVFLNLLSEKNFPLIPDTLDFDGDLEYYKCFTLTWFDHFFIQFPIISVISPPILLISLKNGPSVKFNTVSEMAEHLIENIFYYNCCQ